MSDAVGRPAVELAEPKELLLGYLDYYRSVIAGKLDGLSEAELRSSRLPSGWTALELLKHLVHMEARWLRWGFMAERLPDPWGDEDESGRWHVGPEETAVELIDALHAGGARTRPIVGLTEDEDVGGPWCRHGGRSRGARHRARRPAAELATPPGGTRW